MPSEASEVGASFWVTSQDSKLMNLWLVWRTQKPCSALQWHIERHELFFFFVGTHSFTCAHKHSRIPTVGLSFSLTHE